MSKTSIGQIFTPQYIADFMVSNILNHLYQKENSLEIKPDLEKVHVLEPSVGEGVYLRSLYKYGFNRIIGYEIDSALANTLHEKYPEIDIRFENILKSIPNERFDIVIGNPPYLGHNYNSEIFQDYISHSPICKKYFVGNMDLFYYFIHLGIELLKPGGFLSFITTNYWITKSEKTGIKNLKPHIINECYLVEYIDLSKLTLFSNAQGQQNCIFVLQKKTEKDKMHKRNRKIEIIQANGNRDNNKGSELDYNKKFFVAINNSNSSKYFKKYISATTNNDLKGNRTWNLLYPEKAKELVDKIESYCINNDSISYLKDYFIIRNGLIFIKDNIFILNENEKIISKNGSISLKINEGYVKLTKKEQKILKKLYKSSSIRKYGYYKNNFKRYAIFFNRIEHEKHNMEYLEKFYQEHYPTLFKYLKQNKNQLKAILNNASENPEHYFFPRRGDRIKKKLKDGSYRLMYLQDHYEHSKKIFFPYITDRNIFGYSDESFFATSDTYFLWPKVPQEKIDYPFLLAYLNSEIVLFLFYAKGIKIKRSKTKLENSLPIPNIELLKLKEKNNLISLIRYLSGLMIDLKKNEEDIEIKNFLSQLDLLEYFNSSDKEKDYELLYNLIKDKNRNEILRYIDLLFYDLFDLDKKAIYYLIENYYN